MRVPPNSSVTGFSSFPTTGTYIYTVQYSIFCTEKLMRKQTSPHHHGTDAKSRRNQSIHHRFRHFDEKVGAWKLNPTDKWVDNERKKWLGAVPIRNLDEFVSCYLSARHEPTIFVSQQCSRLRRFRFVDFNVEMRRKGKGPTNTQGRHRSVSRVSRVLLLSPVDVVPLERRILDV
jgi:hypothetical protein